MAQTAEGGHAKIGNGLIEAFARVNLSAYESRVLWCIVRKTYGWNKENDRISYSQFEETTGMKRRHIGRTIKLLIERRIITCQGEGHKLEYGIQKDYEQWRDVRQVDIKPLPKEVTEEAGSTITSLGNREADDNHYLNRSEPLPNQDQPLPKEVTKSLPKQVNTKERKHLTKAYDKSNIAQLFEIFWRAYPRKRSKGNAEKAFKKVAPDEQLMNRILIAIERAKKSEQWLEAGGKFIPYPASWLNAKGWEDEYITPQGGADGADKSVFGKDGEGKSHPKNWGIGDPLPDRKNYHDGIREPID